MGLTLLTERYAPQIAGILSCWDRILLFGTLPRICFAEGMTSYLHARNIRIFDYPRFAEPFRNRLRENAERLAAENGIDIEFLRKRNLRKEDRVKEILTQRGDHPGLVCILSAMEPCSTYKPWHNKQTGKTYLRPDEGKCLHYYFYFIDQALGLGYVRVPTWLPCRLQVYFNGHSWLANLLRQHNIGFRLIDNAFVEIADGQRAQHIADGLQIKRLHRRLDEMAHRFCPIHRDFGVAYHWSVDQCEYATDVVFRKQADLAAIYGNLTRTAIHTVKPDNIATFLGRKLNVEYQGELGNRFTWGVSCQGLCLHVVQCGSQDWGSGSRSTSRTGFLFGAGRAVFRPVAYVQDPGARGRRQGTETLAELRRRAVVAQLVFRSALTPEHAEGGWRTRRAASANGSGALLRGSRHGEVFPALKILGPSPVQTIWLGATRINLTFGRRSCDLTP